MTTLGENKPHAAVTNMRIHMLADRDRIIAELDKNIWTPEQRLSLIRELNFANAELVKMQILASKKWKIRRKNAIVNKERKRAGRTRRTHDSNGEPLYRDSPVLPKADDPEPIDLKSKFLQTLKLEEKTNATE
jgi:hypothetical protein